MEDGIMACELQSPTVRTDFNGKGRQPSEVMSSEDKRAFDRWAQTKCHNWFDLRRVVIAMALAASDSAGPRDVA
jgi:hypothetical protein